MITEYWDFWIGGLLIALVATIITFITGKFLGVTRGYASLCSLFSRHKYFQRPELGGTFGYRTLFALGIIIGGFLAALSHTGFDPTFAYGEFDRLWGDSIWVKAVVLIFGGFLWGYGARMARGCTSGNSISGLSKGSLASLVSTLGFMVAGISLTYLMNFILGAL